MESLSVLNFTLSNRRATMPRTMKPLIMLAPFAIVSTAMASFFQSGDLGIFEPVLQALAELPLVVGLAWILMRQQDKHQDMVDKLIAHFSSRTEARDELYQNTIEKMLQTIDSMAKK